LRDLNRKAAALAFGFCLLGACHSGARSDAMFVSCEVTPQPVRVGPARVFLTMKDAGGDPVNGASIRIEGFMTHPGMAPVSGSVAQTGPGQYTGALDFTMPGDWSLAVRASLPGGAKLERQFDVKGVAAR